MIANSLQDWTLRGSACTRGGRGQALVETALVLPIFLLILFGLIDVGRLVYANNMVSQAAREGVRVAAVQARWVGTPVGTSGCVASAAAITAANPGAHVCPADDATMLANARVAANGELFAVGSVTNIYLSCDGADGSTLPTGAWTRTACSSSPHGSGDLVSVRVVLHYQPITPLVGAFFGAVIGPLNLSGSSTMVIN